MVDFFTISAKSVKKGTTEISPKFIVGKSKDLMIRGGDFYAVWLEDKGVWSTEEDDLIKLIEDETWDFYKNYQTSSTDSIVVKSIRDSDSGVIDRWHKFVQRQQRDSFHPLDEKLIFANDPVRKEDYASKRLPYDIVEGSIENYDKLIGTLYSPEERRKIEWGIGAVLSGDSVNIQKFIVLYGEQGTGKSTILNIIEKLFDGYWSSFSSQVLGQAQNAFALEAFKDNPLVAIDHEGKLSRIEDNTRLNTLIAHEPMLVNNKFEKQYKMAFKSFLFIGTNEPVRITDAKSGILRRLIDVRPSGHKLPVSEYNKLVKGVNYELGAIAKHCLDVYLEDPEYYELYRPTEMMGETNDFYDFMMDYYLDFVDEDMTTLRVAWERYKVYCDEARIQYPMSQRTFKNELKNYFMTYIERGYLEDGSQSWHIYLGFRADRFVTKAPAKHTDSEKKLKIVLKEQESKFDEFLTGCPAQYATAEGTPKKAWDSVTTTINDIDTHKLHYVRVPFNLVTVDFDLKDENGEKSLEKNIEAASMWPPTYIEASQSGKALHAEYIYTGDTSKLANEYAPGIEIKVPIGKAALRRRLTICNDLPITTISSGLPLKGEEKKMVDFEGFKKEENLRKAIIKQLGKGTHPSTKSSMDCIKMILDETYEKGELSYDIRDMRQDIFTFASQSTNQADYCMALIPKMHLCSKDVEQDVNSNGQIMDPDVYTFYDVEIFPNFFGICWADITKTELEQYMQRIKNGESYKDVFGDIKVVKMINPSAVEVEQLCKKALIGFNNFSYDDHMLYARMLGYDNKRLYQLSKKNINSKRGSYDGRFTQAKGLSYTDIFDFASAGNKKGLKKLEIEMGFFHQELGFNWDEEVPEDQWTKIMEYCQNDVRATIASFVYLNGDWMARLILSEIAEMPVSTSTNNLTTKIIFGNDRHPELVYTDFATGKSTDGTFNKFNKFDTYEYIPGPENKGHGRNMYRGEDVGFGGWNYSDPGIYYNVKTFDVAGEHPASIRFLNAFGEYTKRFGELVDLRVAIKHKDYDKARKMLDGKVAKYLTDDSMAKALSNALKTSVNACYGLTFASWDHPMRDPRNENNIVALRGALFMVTLKAEVEKRGFHVISCKTDSLKVVNPSPEIEEFIFGFGKDYGYEFEVENVFEKICLVNTSTFIAKCAEDDPDTPGVWKAKAEQFQVPYLYKKLFTREDILFEDMCEVFSVKEGEIYLDMNEKLPDVSNIEKEKESYDKDYKEGLLSDTHYERLMRELEPLIAKGHDFKFVGRVGQFTPIKSGCGGGVLYRIKDGKRYAVQGTKGYRWLESEVVRKLNMGDAIDVSYYETLCEKAIQTIEEYGSFEKFTSDEPYISEVTNNKDDFMKIPDDIDGDEMPFDDFKKGE